MRTLVPLLTLTAWAWAAPAAAQNPFDLARGAIRQQATGQVEREVNARLLAEGRKNQCSFKTDSDELAPGCKAKVKKLASALVDAKKKLLAAGLKGFRFEVSGHTDSTGDEGHNKELSAKRAAVMVRELVAAGIPEREILSVGHGSERRLVKPDDTPAKRAKNRRYEIRVRL